MTQSGELDLEVKGGGTSKKTLIILISTIVMLVVAIAVGVVLFLTGALTPKAATGEAAANPKAPQHPAIYHSLDPAFVVNFYRQSQQQVRFLQVKMEAMARDSEIIEAIKTHTPAIRNNLLLLLSHQDYETIHTVEGKGQLREAARDEINQVLEDQAGIKGVEAVYFTSFIMQ
ncbi:flagellar basal body-associated protein FliL [Nitrosococcus halophilus Nc 4]|uniref:Flagellar protein FliL n=1 Tax=Nitrosococcus halophilus (strain Nc4) TaxID=472759 RepID=D5C255_NITHN|nr:flagellar basal body-associated FliL family protein [Nitrosococcus halophilus]ADE16643.1 flagellar basal body-associated protein FliL [Nitrosococcus halophilus Nc 4]